jgi:hypothetical protein
MESAFEAREKWNVGKALKDVKHAVETHSGLNRYEKLASWKILVAYISLLELDLKNAKEKLDGLRV